MLVPVARVHGICQGCDGMPGHALALTSQVQHNSPAQLHRSCTAHTAGSTPAAGAARRWLSRTAGVPHVVDFDVLAGGVAKPPVLRLIPAGQTRPSQRAVD